jgi:hypothetical protein
MLCMLFRDLSDFISMTTMRLRGASMNILKMCHEKDLLWYMTILEGGSFSSSAVGRCRVIALPKYPVIIERNITLVKLLAMRKRTWIVD